MKKIRLNLLCRVLIAIALGIVCSLFFPEWAVRVFVTFNSIFGNFLGMFIPILIIGLVTPGIADLGKGAGKLLLVTIALAYVSTVLSGFFSYSVCDWVYPRILGNGVDGETLDMSYEIKPYFTVEMPAFISVTTALVLSFIMGMSIIGINGNTLRNLANDIKEMTYLVIANVIIPILPIFVYGIFLKMGAEGNVSSALGIFAKIILVILALHVTVLVLQFCIAGIIAHKNPFKALRTMLPAYVTALGTQSSAATIPVTLKYVMRLGVKEEIAEFTVPLCATIHMSCSVLKIVACSFALSYVTGMDVSLGTYIGFILMLSITMVAAPGVPGGAIMAALGLVASSLGYDANMQGMLVAVYIALDSFGTAGNVTGDGAISLIVDRISRGKGSNPISGRP